MFIARQPIFNKRLDVYGYELLFRGSSKSMEFDGISSASATATVISGLFECGIDCIVEDKYAFVNFDDDFIHSDTLELIEPKRLIVEVLESVEVDERLTKRLKELKDKGYKIALDDFFENIAEYPLIPIADIIKFDIMATPLETIKADVRAALSRNKTILAEKIETEEEFLKAKEMGFHLFQGYFFSKPKITAKTFSEGTSKMQYLRIIRELKKEEPSFQKIAEIVETDVVLAYRLIRIISNRIDGDLIPSIKKALMYLGLKESERWIYILLMQDYGSNKPKELMRISLIRTRFAEKIALYGGLKKYSIEASMMGLFSVLDAMLDKTMEDALEDISLSKPIKDALIYNKGVLFPVLKLLIDYEKGNWEEAERISKELNIDEIVLREEFLDAIQWARDTMLVIE